jgi:hypothetical protein
LFLYTPTIEFVITSLGLAEIQSYWKRYRSQLQIFWVAVALVGLPVFFQAPLVRAFPWVSLAITPVWLVAGHSLKRYQSSSLRLWGDILIGFSLTWLAGSVYWGWLRWEPVIHIPIEALGLPFVAFYLSRGQQRVGSFFYLGSLLGTAITDLYINWMGLFPAWRQLMLVEPQFATVVLKEAVLALDSDIAICRATVLILMLMLTGLIPMLMSRQLSWWAFSGAVLSTLVVDGLFFVSASFA